MKKHKIHTVYRQMLADTVTPVSIYLKLRDRFPESILLESSDYHGNENSYSYICCRPFASIKAENGTLISSFPEKKPISVSLDGLKLPEEINRFRNAFSFEAQKFPFISNGLFGYISYDAVQYFEDIELAKPSAHDLQIPDVFYSVYNFVIVVNHFRNELFVFNNYTSGSTQDALQEIDQMIYLIKNKTYPSYGFSASDEEKSNFTDEDFLKRLIKIKEHNKRGDVFQLVLSRKFSRKFKGDEFNVYRSLRSINPSPYLFYFDYGNFKIFGSSPEAQLIVKNGRASIHPIAGTFGRTGDDEADAKLAEKLKMDEKENAEHVMLVDLARNDLSRNCEQVHVETFREIQYYSHVIHLVSKVSAKLHPGISAMQVMADSFPAGTLSGAPKFKAMELIHQYEFGRRGYYGGCIGYLGFDDEFNHAIMIRTFLSTDNTLHYQAGAGVVDQSIVVNELEEVNNKLRALKSAIKLAEEI